MCKFKQPYIRKYHNILEAGLIEYDLKEKTVSLF